MRRYYYIDLLRIIACLAVIVIHVSGSNLNNVPINSPVWQVFNIFNSLPRFSVPCFVMISGVFLLSPDRCLKINELYRKKIPKTAAIWIVWELFYAVVDFIWSKGTFSPAALNEILRTALSGHYHLWYLPMLIGLYIATPILRAVTEKKDSKLCLYAVIICFMSVALKPALHLLGLPSYINDFLDKILIAFFGGYIGYFILGYYLFTYPLLKHIKIVLYVLGFLGALTVILFKDNFSHPSLSTNGIGFDFVSVPVIFMSISVFLFFKEQVSKISLSDKSSKIFGSISSCTLGVYLLHAYVLERLYEMGITTLSMNPVVAVLLISIAGFFISLIIVSILRKIPAVRKYLV